MNHDIYKDIRRDLAKVHLCNFLESMCSSKRTQINRYMLEELMILANQPDIFQRDIDGEMENFVIVDGNVYLTVLQKLNLITTFKYERSGDHYYEFCKLTPLGEDFVTENTNLKKTSQALLKMHHNKLIKDILMFPIIFLIVLCAFSILLLLMIGTNGFTTHFYISSKIISSLISPAVIVIFAFIITSFISWVAVSCATEPAVTRSDQPLDDQYDDLCRFISEPFVKQTVTHKTSLITLDTFLNFIADHLDAYSQMTNLVYSLKPLESLLIDHLFKYEKPN